MNNRKIIFLAIAAGSVYWFEDAVFNKFVLSLDLSFWSSLLHDFQSHSFYYRHTAIVLIGISVMLHSLLYNKIKNENVSYQQLLDNVNDAVFIKSSIGCDEAEKLIEVNEVACEMLGYTKEEILQFSTQALIDPEGLDDYWHSMDSLKNAGHASFRTVLLKKDGSKIPVEINAHTLNFKGKTVCSAIVRDISAELAAEKGLKESLQHFQVLAERLIGVQEEERERLSKELHDELGQNLIFLKMKVSCLQSHLPETLPNLRKECGKLLSHVDETVENVRRLSQDLNPRVLEEMGMSAAVETLIRESCELYGVKSLILDLDKIDARLSVTAQLNLYRLFQESLTNIGKHAHATGILVKIKDQGSRIFIRIEDNGKGFDPLQRSFKKKGIGISTIHERARLIGGFLNIRSHPGRGTEIILTIPLKKMAVAGRRKWGNESVPHLIS